MNFIPAWTAINVGSGASLTMNVTDGSTTSPETHTMLAQLTLPIEHLEQWQMPQQLKPLVLYLPIIQEVLLQK